MTHNHHVIRQQTIKQAISAAAAKSKVVGKTLTDGERRLLDTPLHVILDDRRNLVRDVPHDRHHRAHQGVEPERFKRTDLHRQIDEFAAWYGLEWALDRELELIDTGRRT
jgi:hypothetical protein